MKQRVTTHCCYKSRLVFSCCF